MASVKELMELLGCKPSTRGHLVYNLAIRKCMVGGNELLNALALTYELNKKLTDADMAGQDESNAALSALTSLRNLMEDLVRTRSIENMRVLNDETQ